jgi:hypothetical protein
MIVPFSESGFRVSRYRDSCCRVSCLFNLRNLKCRIAEIFGRVLLHNCVAFHDFGNSGAKDPDSLSSKTPKCRIPIRSAKAGSPMVMNETLSPIQSFGLRDFVNPDARLLDSPTFETLKWSMKIDTTWQRVCATCLLSCPVSLSWIPATCHSSQFSGLEQAFDCRSLTTSKS